MNFARSQLAVLLVAVTLVLTGCQARDEVNSRIDSGRLVLIPCESVDALIVRVYSRPLGTDDELKLVWSVSGDSEFGSQAPITYGITPAGWNQLIEPADLDLKKSYVQVAMIGIDHGVRRTVGWYISGDQLSESKWLDQDGRLSDDHC